MWSTRYYPQTVWELNVNLIGFYCLNSELSHENILYFNPELHYCKIPKYVCFIHKQLCDLYFLFLLWVGLGAISS